MKNLWTPWRIDYILGNEKKYDGCIFEAAKGKNYDRDMLVLYRDSLAVILLNRFPYANGHLLVAPTRHVADLEDLDHHEASGLMEMLKTCTAILKKHLQPDGFNIGLNLGKTAGAGLAEHLHFHIVPRWDGDHNFMATIGAIRTIPEHITRTFDQLLDDFQKIIMTAAANK
jgi:ATP adenylyltransferase